MSVSLGWISQESIKVHGYREGTRYQETPDSWLGTHRSTHVWSRHRPTLRNRLLGLSQIQCRHWVFSHFPINLKLILGFCVSEDRVLFILTGRTHSRYWGLCLRSGVSGNPVCAPASGKPSELLLDMITLIGGCDFQPSLWGIYHERDGEGIVKENKRSLFQSSKWRRNNTEYFADIGLTNGEEIQAEAATRDYWMWLCKACDQLCAN